MEIDGWEVTVPPDITTPGERACWDDGYEFGCLVTRRSYGPAAFVYGFGSGLIIGLVLFGVAIWARGG